MNSKKFILKAFAAIGILLILLIVVALILWIVSSNIKATPKYDYDFYDPNYNLNLKDYPDYLNKNRDIKYTDETTQQIEITADNYKELGMTAEFFYDYFETIKNGDAKGYNALFEKKLLRKRGEKKKFTKQMIYDIDVTFLSETEIDSDTDAVQYVVRYSIYHNDGTFRNDIGSDMSRKQFITVYYDLNTGKGKIHNIQTEYYLQ